MKKVGDFWIPDVDLNIFSRFGKTRRKTIRHFASGGTKLEDLEEALSYLEKGGVAVDGGANVGAYTRRLAQHFDLVHAFEPAADTFEALSRNVREWGLSERVRLYDKALSDRTEQVGLARRRGQRSVSRRVQGSGNIHAITIDSLQLQSLAFLKLDIEGHEYRALLGARETLSRCRPAVLFEDKPGKLREDKSENPHDLLRSLGATETACIGPRRFDWLYRFE